MKNTVLERYPPTLHNGCHDNRHSVSKHRHIITYQLAHHNHTAKLMERVLTGGLIRTGTTESCLQCLIPSVGNTDPYSIMEQLTPNTVVAKWNMLLVGLLSLLVCLCALKARTITSVANFTLFGVDLRFFYCPRLRFSRYCPASTDIALLLQILPCFYRYCPASTDIALLLRFCTLSYHLCWQIYAFLFSEAANLP